MSHQAQYMHLQRLTAILTISCMFPVMERISVQPLLQEHMERLKRLARPLNQAILRLHLKPLAGIRQHQRRLGLYILQALCLMQPNLVRLVAVQILHIQRLWSIETELLHRLKLELNGLQRLEHTAGLYMDSVSMLRQTQVHLLLRWQRSTHGSRRYRIPDRRPELPVGCW